MREESRLILEGLQKPTWVGRYSWHILPVPLQRGDKDGIIKPMSCMWVYNVDSTNRFLKFNILSILP